MGKKENQLNPNDEVCTPPAIYERVLKALGVDRFSFDPCSHPDSTIPADYRVLLPKYERLSSPISLPDGTSVRIADYHASDLIYGDGLKLSWEDQLPWLNPPYSQLQYPKKYPWLEKLSKEAEQGVAFLPVRTSSGWWHEGVLNNPHADILVQLKGRVQHVGHECGSPFHQVLVGYNVIPTLAEQRAWTHDNAEEYLLEEKWRPAFNHPHGGFVSSLRRMRQ